jgi:hypothetical protein
MVWRRFQLATCLLAGVCVFGCGLAGCSPGSGAVVLEARSGRVVDRESGAPVPGADVYQAYWGKGVAGEPRSVRALRWTTADAAGRFSFEERLSSEPGSWVPLETSEAEYGFYQPDYGLVRLGRPDAGGPVTLEGVPLDVEQRRAAELSLCGSRPADEVAAHVARSHCDRVSP